MDALKQSYTYGHSPLPNNAPSTPYKTYLFGKPISHSLSPLLQNTMFQHPPSKWTFHLAESTDPAHFRKTLEEPSCIGTSITMPNKLSFQTVLDTLTDEARVMGSVNTTFVRISKTGKRVYIGTNTDCIGTRDAILVKAPDAAAKAKGKPAMVVGAGGAARSSIYALWKWFGVSEVYVVNRDKGEVDVLIRELKGSMPGLSIRHLEPVQEASVCVSPFLVIGTVPDFEPKEAGEILCRAVVEAVLGRGTEGGVVADMCYSPSVWTVVYSAGVRNGWRVVSGVEIVVRVCIAQQVLWLERMPDEGGVKEALEAAEKINAADSRS